MHSYLTHPVDNQGTSWDTHFSKVAVVMGGNSPEREISFMSGQAILQALLNNKINAFVFDPAKAPLADLKDRYGCTQAFLTIHGPNGEDGKLQGALEYLGIAYTGSGVTASCLGMDKYRSKLIWQALGIPVPNAQLISKNSYNAQMISQLSLPLPLVVKPNDSGSTLGLTKVYTTDQLKPAIAHAFSVTNTVLVEQLIAGAEFSLAIINSKTYPLVKIEAPHGNYDFNHKYYTDDTKYLCPYSLGSLHAEIERLALTAYNGIGAVGAARLDFILDSNNQCYFLEINTLPGMTHHSLLPKAAAAVGISFDQLCLMILAGAGINK